jgi:Circadian oscillating protein COP23
MRPLSGFRIGLPASVWPALMLSLVAPSLGAAGVLGAATPAAAATFPHLVFECPIGGRLMFARTTRGPARQTPLIQFTSMGKRSAAERCQTVTERFNRLNGATSNDTLAFLTTGLRNGQVIVCSVPEYGAACDQRNGTQLLTLNAQDRSPDRRDQALGLLLIRLHNATARTPVLLDSPSRLYVDLRELVNSGLAEDRPLPPDAIPVPRP